MYAAVRTDDGVRTPPPASRTGHVPFEGGQTWYRVTEATDAAEAADASDASDAVGAIAGPYPVVVLHGGPGLAHNGCLPMANLARQGRAVVHYDQIGCGQSTHFPDADPNWWTIDLFIRELATVTRALRIDRFHLIGHSWGGMLGAEYALRHPETLASLTICNSPASMELWMQAADEAIAALPEDIQRSIRINERAGTTDSPDYERAMAHIYERHFCRVVPTPQDLRDTLAQAAADPTVYHTMNGPSEFTVTGSLKNWSIVDRLAGITSPTLVLAGEHDEASPATWRPFVDLIPDARAHVFAGASHTPHWETPQQWLQVVGEFLRQHDSPLRREYP
jgi:L-proline amide hydrolase